MRKIIVTSVIVFSLLGCIVSGCSEHSHVPVSSELKNEKEPTSFADSGPEKAKDEMKAPESKGVEAEEHSTPPDVIISENYIDKNVFPEKSSEQQNERESKGEEPTAESFQRVPRITNVLPPSVCSEVTTKVQVQGQFFTKGSLIYVGTKKFPTVFHSSNLLEAEITIYTPNLEFDLTVENVDRIASNRWKIVALEDIPPTLQSLTPEKVKQTDVAYVSVQGKQFPSSPMIVIGNKLFPTQRISRSELRTLKPVDFGSFKVGVHRIWVKYSGCIGKSNSLLFEVGP